MNGVFSAPGPGFQTFSGIIAHYKLLILCILMDSSFWFDIIHLGWSIGTYQGVSVYNFQKTLSFCLKIFPLTNSVDPDEIQHYSAFHLGLHCL